MRPKVTLGLPLSVSNQIVKSYQLREYNIFFANSSRCRKKIKCRERESDSPRRPFQGRALPLSYLGDIKLLTFLPQITKKSSRLSFFLGEYPGKTKYSKADDQPPGNNQEKPAGYIHFTSCAFLPLFLQAIFTSIAKVKNKANNPILVARING